MNSIDEFGTTVGVRGHHEGTKLFQERFHGVVQKVYTGMSCNPVELGKLTTANNPSSCFPDTMFENMCRLQETGKTVC